MIEGLKYDPKEIKIEKGEKVVWENVSRSVHTVTADEDSLPNRAEYFASGGYENEDKARKEFGENQGGRVPYGKKYEHKFKVKGEYRYFCVPHQGAGMEGKVIVE